MKTTKPLIAVLFALLITQAASAFYDPQTGRWLSRDPIGEPGFETLRAATTTPQVGTISMPPGRWIKRDSPNSALDKANLYGFVGNNPENKIDTFGLKDAIKDNPKDCWQTVQDFYCGDKKGLTKKCCEKGLAALFDSVPGAQKYACNVVAHNCRNCCALSFEDDDNKKDACIRNCQLQQAFCAVQSF